VNEAPLSVPEMVKVKPCGSEADKFSVDAPTHQPLLPIREQPMLPLTVGG
jgi:hypothetical protein